MKYHCTVFSNFMNHNKSMLFKLRHLYIHAKHVWKVKELIVKRQQVCFCTYHMMFSLLVDKFEFCWPEFALMKFDREIQISWLKKININYLTRATFTKRYLLIKNFAPLSTLYSSYLQVIEQAHHHLFMVKCYH